MKTHRSVFVSMLMTLSVTTQAQDNAAPAPAAAPAQTEMQKWIASTDVQWQAAFNRDVTDVYAAELKKLALQYVTSLEAATAKASAAGDLNGAVALRNEQKRFADTNVFPEQDDVSDAASVKQLRAAIRVQLARLAKDNATRTKALHVKYDQMLAQVQTQLTQRQRLDDALLVKAKRDEVAAAWITPAIAAGIDNPDSRRTAVAGAENPGTPPVVAKKAVPFYAKQAPPRSILIKARIDGHDLFHYSDGKLWIEHLSAQKPLQITINGVPWQPVWNGNETEPFTAFSPLPAPFGESRPRFKQIAGRDKAKLEKLPTVNVKKIATIDVSDVPGGDDIYEFQLSW